LAAVSDLWILAEYTNGISETADLDNVALNSTDVPESASTLLCGVVLMALGLLRRRTG
jgi:hypothetical protein